MAHSGETLWYCPVCGNSNRGTAQLCRVCAESRGSRPEQFRRGVAFFLTELEALHREGVVPDALYTQLRQRYREALGVTGDPAAQEPASVPTPAPAEPEAPPAPAAPVRASVPTPDPAPRPPPPVDKPAKPEGPGWLAEQQANLLLYLGAFLIVIAALILVNASGESFGDWARMALLILGTGLFLAAGLVCFRFPNVNQAGIVFFAVGAIMVPIDFAGGYVIFLEEDDIDPTGLWLAGSLASAAFYGAVSFLGIGRWYPVPMTAAILSALGAALHLAGAPPAAYPVSYIGAAFLLASPAVLNLGRWSEVLGLVWGWASQAVVVGAFLVALALIYEEGPAAALAASLAGAVFFGGLAHLGVRGQETVPRVVYAVLAMAGVLSSLGLALALADAPPAAYPASYVGLALLLASPSLAPLKRASDVFGLAGSGVSNVVVPVAFAAAVLLIDQEGFNGALAASLASVLFYGAVSLGRVDHRVPLAPELYPVALALAMLSSLGFALLVADAPPEAYPGSYVALASVMAAPSLLKMGKTTTVFGVTGSLVGHAFVPPALLAALFVTVADPEDVELGTRWYLPATAGAGVVFYWSHTLLNGVLRPYRDYLTIAALGVTGGAAITLVYALGVGEQWYGPAVAIVAWIYAAGSERFGPSWFGQRHLSWMAVAAVTVAWLAFEGLYADFPRQGAGVHFAAAALYLMGARLTTMTFPLHMGAAGDEREPTVDIRLSAGLVYAGGLTIGIGFFYLLSSLPAAEDAGASDLSKAFFGLSLALAAVAATLRLWWQDVRLHAYVITAGVGLFVLLSSLGSEGQITVQLGVYTGVAVAVALWERQPIALIVPAVLGFFAVLAAWRHYEPIDLYLPLVFSAIAAGLFAVHVALRSRTKDWPSVLLVLAFAYALVAPIAGWVRLSDLADPAGFVGVRSFEETGLYQTSAAAVLVLALLILAQARLVRRVDLAAGATPLLMVALLLQIGHYRPENVQAYTAPLGMYLLIGASLAMRVRSQLPAGLDRLVEPLQAVGAATLMAPGLFQSFEDGGWPYALLLLVEGLMLIGVAVVQRWLWLLSTSISFVVLDSLQYLMSGAETLPTWAIVAVAGLLVMAAGFGILLGRERWSSWQRSVQLWWEREAAPSGVD